MDEKNHTVTIPISDYNDFMKIKDLIGVKKLNSATPMWLRIDTSLRKLSLENGGPDIGIPMNIELYFKEI